MRVLSSSGVVVSQPGSRVYRAQSLQLCVQRRGLKRNPTATVKLGRAILLFLPVDNPRDAMTTFVRPSLSLVVSGMAIDDHPVQRPSHFLGYALIPLGMASNPRLFPHLYEDIRHPRDLDPLNPSALERLRELRPHELTVRAIPEHAVTVAVHAQAVVPDTIRSLEDGASKGWDILMFKDSAPWELKVIRLIDGRHRRALAIERERLNREDLLRYVRRLLECDEEDCGPLLTYCEREYERLQSCTYWLAMVYA